MAVTQRRPGEAAEPQATAAKEATAQATDGWSGSTFPITSAHTVRVLAGAGSLVCRRKALPTVERLGKLERAALAGPQRAPCLRW